MSHTHTVALMQRDDTQLLQQRQSHITSYTCHTTQGHTSCHNYSYKIMPAETDDHGYITTPSNAVTPTGTSGQTVTHTSTQQHTHTQCHTCSLSQTHTQIAQLHLRRQSHRNTDSVLCQRQMVTVVFNHTVTVHTVTHTVT